jgi:hypothetical protein
MLAIWATGGEFQVQVAQSLVDRERVAMDVATRVGLPIVLALPLLALLIYLAVRRAVRPLDLLADGLTARSPDNLEALPENGEAPSEVRPLVHALNHLLTRLRTALDNERRFTADAAHELRTPLAAIKIQSQVALASSEEADRSHALRQVQAGTDRASRLVDQLLRLARLDPLAEITHTTDVRLDDLVAQLADEMAPMARLLGKSLGLVDTPDEVVARGDADLLRVALRNLIENALRHTPEGCEVTLGASLVKGLPLLWVRDTGPGVAEEELSLLFFGAGASPSPPGIGQPSERRIDRVHSVERGFHATRFKGTPGLKAYCLKAYWPFALLFLASAGLTRVVLTLAVGPATASPGLWPRLFLLGFGFDLAVLAWLLAPLLLRDAFWPTRWRLVKWKKSLRLAWFFLATALFLFAALAEWTFWEEFATRFNFIAVDYLIYTHEVIGNIQSSPIR